MIMGMKFVLFLASVCMMGFAACDGDGDADYGFGKIYMPQAMQSGGLNNSYAVPSGDGEYTYNFRVTAGYVKAVLGVTRSGKLSDARGFSVSVYTSEEETAAAVSQFGGEPMPSDFYEPLPRSVTVPSGKSGEVFYLEIPRSGLSDPANAGKKYVLAVGISDPTAYELAETGTVTAVIVDVDALNDAVEAL